MSEVKEKRKASFGIEIYQNVGKFHFHIFDKDGTIILSNGSDTLEKCKARLTRLRKVCKNRYTATKIKSE